MTNMDSLISPQCISAYVIHRTAGAARYLLIRRCSKYLPGTWQMVSGGIEQGETASAAALREIREETGLAPSSFYAADIVETFYMPSCDKIACVPVFVAFVEETTVHLSPKEHDAYEWLTFEEARDRLVWAGQKRVITHIHHCFILNQPNRLLAIENTIHSPAAKVTISRTGVYGLVIKEQKILLVKQDKGPHCGKWDLPGGGIEAGETIDRALRRELLEEVSMSFDTMQFLANLTATTDGINEQGSSYSLHQIGLIYSIDGLTHTNDQTAEMEHAWVDLQELQPEIVSPFVREILALNQAAPLKEESWTAQLK